MVETQTRIALGVEYDGSQFHGWQWQSHDQKTVQAVLETALSRVADRPIKTICAGRTDSGVHAVGQVAHFDSDVVRPDRAWVQGTNTHLPPTVRVRWARQVSDNFHARFSAHARTYRYVIDNHSVRSAVMHNQLTYCYRPLSVELMAEAAQHLVGKHDFTSYRAAHCQAKNPVRTVHELRVERQDEWVFITVKANAFLHHMVRNIAGVLMAVGSGKVPPAWAQEVLTAKDRKLGGETAQPHGLYLIRIHYPEEFHIPTPEPGLPFLRD